LLQRLGRKLFGGRLPFSESRPKVEKSALQVEEKGNEEPDQWSLYSQEEDYFGNFAFAEEFAEEPDYYCGLSDDCEFEGFPLVSINLFAQK
jgi:hypothetical protein